MYYIPKKRKIEFLKTVKSIWTACSYVLGRSNLRSFHTGVCKALIEQDLMPKVLSGSSAGAIMTGMLGISASEDIQNLLNGEQFLVMLFTLENFVNL